MYSLCGLNNVSFPNFFHCISHIQKANGIRQKQLIAGRRTWCTLGSQTVSPQTKSTESVGLTRHTYMPKCQIVPRCLSNNQCASVTATNLAKYRQHVTPSFHPLLRRPKSLATVLSSTKQSVHRHEVEKQNK